MNRKETEPLCLLRFDLQWKNNPLAKAAGLWVAEDITLDSDAFKSYVAQNLGTVEDILISYVDSDGDELPIESECEFKEALKLAKHRAKDKRKVLIKVDKLSKFDLLKKPLEENIKRMEELKNIKLKRNPQGLPCFETPVQFFIPSDRDWSNVTNIDSKEKGNCTVINHDVQFEERISACAAAPKDPVKVPPKITSPTTASSEEPPKWFRKHMKKFKLELLQEVEVKVKKIVTKALEEERKHTSKTQIQKEQKDIIINMLTKKFAQQEKRKPPKKKFSDEDSSDGIVIDQRDYKILKKIERLNREKKFEKLDSKMEKLENRTKKFFEKKSQSKSKSEKKEKSSEPSSKQSELKPSNDISVNCFLMDASILEKPPSLEVHIHPGRHFLKVWNVMNSGTLPWTDKTELRLAWGTPGLQFDKTVVKCPELMPGQKGRISVRGQAPNYPGAFECYWHFYHMGVRFGHWIDCTVVVEPVDEVDEVDEDLKRADDVFMRPEEHVKGKLLSNQINDDKIDRKELSRMFSIANLIPEKKRRAQTIYQLERLALNMIRPPPPCSRPNSCFGNCLHPPEKDEAFNTEDFNSNESKSSSVASETVKENQRKIEATIVEIRKMLEDITFMPVPPTKDKILEMVGADDFSKDIKKDTVEESDNADDHIDIDYITGKNIEPAEWKALQLHPEFMTLSCDMFRKMTIREDPVVLNETSNENYLNVLKVKPNENYCTLKRDSSARDDLINFSCGDNDLDKPQEISESFTRNIPDDENATDTKIDNTEGEGEKNPGYESDSDSELSVISTFSTSTEPEDDENFEFVVAMPMNNSPDSPRESRGFKNRPENQNETSSDNVEKEEATGGESASALSPPEEAAKNEDSPKTEGLSEETVPEKEESANKARRFVIRTTDPLGKIIYAVNSRGQCFPIDWVLNSNSKDRKMHASFERFTIPLRRTRFGEPDRNESQTKKMKSSKSADQHCDFIASPSKIFCAYQEAKPKTFNIQPQPMNKEASSGMFNTTWKSGKTPAPPTFTFTATQQEGKPSCPSCTSRKERKEKVEKVWRQSVAKNYSQQSENMYPERKRGLTSKAPTVDILPNSFMHGAFNVASSAISTARSVINNLQSAFLPEGGDQSQDQAQASATASGPSSNQNTGSEGFSFEAMYRLYEMGFTDIQKNRKLLLCHNNFMEKVVEDLVADSRNESD